MSNLQEINCPDCGPVHPAPDTWERGVTVSGICPKCRERICYAPSFMPLTPEEAQAAYDAAEPVPLSKERIQEIVDFAVGRAVCSICHKASERSQWRYNRCPECGEMRQEEFIDAVMASTLPPDKKAMWAREVLWEAINEYAAACGGDTSNATVSDRRMKAVAAVERAIAAGGIGS